MKTKSAIFVLGLGLSAITAAPVATKKTLTMDGAERVIHAAIEEAAKRKTTGVIAVVDDGGNLMALERIDGTFPAGANISIGKARTAAIFRRPSKDFEDQIRTGRVAALALPGATPLQGGVPIAYRGQVIGAIGVSGESPQEDEDVAKAGAAAAAAAINEEGKSHE